MQILFIDRKTDADLDSRVAAVADSFDCRGKSALLAPKSVMRFFQTVKTHTHIGKADFLEFGRNSLVISVPLVEMTARIPLSVAYCASSSKSGRKMARRRKRESPVSRTKPDRQ
jgi:hypothetical protein